MRNRRCHRRGVRSTARGIVLEEPAREVAPCPRRGAGDADRGARQPLGRSAHHQRGRHAVIGEQRAGAPAVVASVTVVAASRRVIDDRVARRACRSATPGRCPRRSSGRLRRRRRRRTGRGRAVSAMSSIARRDRPGRGAATRARRGVAEHGARCAGVASSSGHSGLHVLLVRDLAAVAVMPKPTLARRRAAGTTTRSRAAGRARTRRTGRARRRADVA